MKRTLIIVGIIVVVGIAVWLASPFFYSREVNESLADIVGEMKVVTMEEKEQMEASNAPETSEVMEKKTEGAAMTKKPAEAKAQADTSQPAPTAPVTPEPAPQPQPQPQSEPQPLQPAEPMAVIAGQGTFSGLAGHNGSGKATLIKVGDKYYVRFEDDFRVTNGPDLYVDLGRSGEHDGAARLGRLKGSVGGQNYEVPAGIDVSAYNEVWVWCRAFSVPFAKASWL